MRCECGAKMYLGAKGWECSVCHKIEEAVLISFEDYDKRLDNR